MAAAAHHLLFDAALFLLLFAMRAAEALPFGHRAFATGVATSFCGLLHDDLLICRCFRSNRCTGRGNDMPDGSFIGAALLLFSRLNPKQESW
jgi:hypothetical protein